MKISIVSAFAALTLLFLASGVHATQYGPYEGPPPSASILVDKLVARPIENKGGATEWDFVDNISKDDHTFSPDSPVFFRVVVKNTSDKDLKGVTVKDFVPEFLVPFEGHGNFDEATRVITIDAGDFAKGEEKTYTLNMKVKPGAELPGDKALLCPTNRVRAENSEVADEDTSQFCIEHAVTTTITTTKGGVTDAQEIPSAGPEDNMGFIVGMAVVMGLAGIRLVNVEGKHLRKHQ